MNYTRYIMPINPLASFVREQRKLAGLTQPQLADVAGVGLRVFGHRLAPVPAPKQVGTIANRDGTYEFIYDSAYCAQPVRFFRLFRRRFINTSQQLKKPVIHVKVISANSVLG